MREPVAVEAVDVDNDGDLEVVFANRRAGGNQPRDIRFLEVVGGSLEPSTFPSQGLNPGEVVTDLAVDSDATGLVRVFAAISTNTADGLVRAYSKSLGSSDFLSCDLPIIGADPDVVNAINTGPTLAPNGRSVVASSPATGQLFVYLNDAGMPGEWSSRVIPVGDLPGDVIGADLDGDSLDDLIVVNEGDSTISVVRNAGDAFAAAVAVPAPPSPTSLAVADLDSDQDRDVAVIAAGPTGERVVQFLRNTFTASGTISLAGAEVLESQPTGTPTLLRSGDLEQTAVGIEDDLVVLVAPGNARARNAPRHAVVQTSPPPAACPADINGDGVVTGVDFTDFILAFGAGAPVADQNGDGVVTGVDFTDFINNFGAGCP